MKTDLKTQAIQLRKEGLSYSEILKKVPVAKSTLSLWLHSVNLSKKQYQRLTEKKLASMRRGWLKVNALRLERVQKIHNEAQAQVVRFIDNPLWLAGVLLYWAEGSKEKEYQPGSRVEFTNSDPLMLKLFLKWLSEICNIPMSDVRFEIYIHENSQNRLGVVAQYWSKRLGVPRNFFKNVYFKKNIIKTRRKNIGKNYYGLLKLRVKASSTLNRRIAGWINGVNQYWGVV